MILNKKLKEILKLMFLFFRKSLQLASSFWSIRFMLFPGGYTSANDIMKVQLLESEWGEAIRAGMK